MSSSHNPVGSMFRSASALVYTLNILVSISFIVNGIYLNIVVGAYTSLISFMLLLINIKKPKGLMDRLSNSKYDFLFTFRGRYMLDFFCSLFLLGMGYQGFFMGIITMGLIFGIRLAGVQNPDAFNDMFKVPIPEASDTEGEGYSGESMAEGGYNNSDAYQSDVYQSDAVEYSSANERYANDSDQYDRRT
uniref:Uncharacterized protein n=1 Tax=Corethron hystrix TaxID=216773 RepID=A0A6U5MGV0_9STRA|mmetsp:Transcript_9960/g.22224  ORF Transcript_9960/g.22224 Transcript_9960/m.22224 type:complete len:190 (+) Transcript_9960:154-723(+)